MANYRAHTPSAAYGGVPTPHDPAHLSRGYGPSSQLDVDANAFGSTPANPTDPSPLSQSLQRSQSQRSQRLGRFEENFDAHTRGSSVLGDGDVPERSASRASTLNQGAAPSRSGTLKKKSSVKRSSSLRRSGSRRSTHAGSIRGVNIDDNEEQSKYNGVFYTPVPTSGSPTEILANRFQAWRKLLKDLMTYFREVATSYEQRAKSLHKVSNVINNTNAPSVFMTEGGLNDANRILRDFYKQSLSEANKARDIETEIVSQLGGLRADLGQKIKEIKSLSGDFKNSVEKEKETTRKCVASLEESLQLIDRDPSAVAGKGDPFVVRLGVDRQVERQIDEENYLHRAYLNLENSGRELESIVVGEIQKAYNALASILKRDADEIYSAVEKLRDGPVGMPRDFEWNQFVTNDSHFVNPSLPLRRLEDIQYPGKNHPATVEVRAGMLERKTKYLKSYTPGWYVLSPTHLHEFKSADRIYTQPPVMSLYLPDQKLGSHSQPGSSSHKFVLKGRQTGSMHRGHTWVFRAETYDTMLAWYEDVKTLTEKTGEERNAFVRRTHARSLSQGSARSISSDGGLEDNEADEVPYSATQSMLHEPVKDETPQRPSPGGRFPSDVNVDRNLQAPLSSNSSEVGNDLTTAAGGLQGNHDALLPTTTGVSQVPSQTAFAYEHNTENPYLPQPPNAASLTQAPAFPQNPARESSINSHDPIAPSVAVAQPTYTSTAPLPTYPPAQPHVERHISNYGEWMAPAAAAGAAGAGNASSNAYPSSPQNTIEHRAHDNLYDVDTLHDTQAIPLPIPIPFSAAHASEPESLVSTPATQHQTFLGRVDDVESAEPVNGGPALPKTGPVPPVVARHNTDHTVSQLHVPGEYPRQV